MWKHLRASKPFFQQHLPENAFKRKKGEVILHPKVENAFKTPVFRFKINWLP